MDLKSGVGNHRKLLYILKYLPDVRNYLYLPYNLKFPPPLKEEPDWMILNVSIAYQLWYHVK